MAAQSIGKLIVEAHANAARFAADIEAARRSVREVCQARIDFTKILDLDHEERMKKEERT